MFKQLRNNTKVVAAACFAAGYYVGRKYDFDLKFVAKKVEG